MREEPHVKEVFQMAEFKYCRNCGKQLEPGVRVCMGCGVPVGTGHRYCWNCGGAAGRKVQSGGGAAWYLSRVAGHP